MKSKPNWEILWYLLLIISAVFLDVDLLSLLAIPLFLVSTVGLMTYYLTWITKQAPHRHLARVMVITGMLLLSAIVGYAAIKYGAVLRADNDIGLEEPFPSLILTVVQIAGIDLFSVLLILIGLKLGRSATNHKLYGIGVLTLLLLPVVIGLMKVLPLHTMGI